MENKKPKPQLVQIQPQKSIALTVQRSDKKMIQAYVNFLYLVLKGKFVQHRQELQIKLFKSYRDNLIQPQVNYISFTNDVLI